MALLLFYDWKCVSLYISTAFLLVACQKRSQVCMQHTFPIIPSSGSIRMKSHNAVFPGRRACVWVKRMSSRWRTHSSGLYRERSDRNWELLSWPMWVFLLDWLSLNNSVLFNLLVLWSTESMWSERWLHTSGNRGGLSFLVSGSMTGSVCLIIFLVLHYNFCGRFEWLSRQY